MSFLRVNENCNGCLACEQNCPASAIYHEDNGSNRKIFHNISLCARCGNCWRICPQKAIEFQNMLRGRWEEVSSMELVHCAVCGEPIYTSNFEKTLMNKISNGDRPLCPEHKKAVPLNLWKQVASGRTAPEGDKK